MSEAKKIEGKIVGFEVVKPEDPAEAPRNESEESRPLMMSEEVARPETLVGTTYKVKPPVSEHALYVTINDIVLNEGTEHEMRRPFEIFINSKNMEHFQWMVALTRIISAVFRKGGDATFLIEEMGSVFDPRGGYFKKGGKYMPSLVAEIGEILKTHFVGLGMVEPEGLDEHQKRLIEEKKAQLEAAKKDSGDETDAESQFPPEAVLCHKCNTKAAVKLDGCLTCLNCGEAKCG